MKSKLFILLLFDFFYLIYGFDQINNRHNEISGISLLYDEQNSLLSRQKCSGESEQFINQCLQPILNYATFMQDETKSTHLGLQGSEIFQKLCVLYRQFNECAKPIMCSSISIRAIDASYGYMCGQGYKLFEEHASCFVEVENQSEYVHCKYSAGRAMDEASKLKKTNVEEYFQNLCIIMKDYLHCCQPFVHKKCGNEAWELVAQVTMDSLKVTMPSCNLTEAFK